MLRSQSSNRWQITVMRRASLKACSLVALSLLAVASEAQKAHISPDAYLAHVKYLASPEMKGRLTGTPQLEKAAEYLAAQFRSYGLRPGNGRSYFQEFEVTTSSSLGKNDRAVLKIDAKTLPLQEHKDYVPLNFSTNGSVSAPVVFAGYGITAPEYNYDDYAGLDVKGKVVIVLKHEPQESDEKSLFEGRSYTIHSQLNSKAINAKLHGARAMLIVNDTANHPGISDDLERFSKLVGPANMGILATQVTVKTADELLASSHRKLEELAKGIDADLKPRSFALAPSVSASITVQLNVEKKKVNNVLAFLPGETDEYLIVGAHYDHLGLGQQYSMAPSKIGTVHPGADDNASGTAGVLELARYFEQQPQQRRGILFLCFAGEELGLLGSSYYVEHPTRPLEDAIAMINMDMIGRLRNNKVYVGGVGTGSTFKQIVAESASHFGFVADQSEQGGYGSSDHASFTPKQIPTLFFFSGLHGDYHKPSDTWDKINARDAARLLDDIGEVITKLADSSERPAFVRVQRRASPHEGAGPISAAAGSGYGPYFGSVPDFAEVENGVRFSDIRDGSPAAKAGLKAGDTLIEFDGKPIKNLYDFTYALRQHRPGDTVTVKVIRDKSPMEAKVLLTKRD